MDNLKEFIFNQKELLLIACTLHDIGYLEGRDDHALSGGILAEKYLKKLNALVQERIKRENKKK